MKMKKTKDQVQTEALLAIEKNNGRGIIAMATGTGKSKIAIDRIVKRVSDNFDLNVLIVVPTEKLRDETWKDEFEKWNQSFVWKNNVERSCYASISKIEGMEYDIVILDEGHNITPANSEFFDKNTIGDIILLTATPPVKLEKTTILDRLGLSVIYKVTLDQAVEWGLISPYKITVVYTTLNASSKYIKAGNKKKSFFTTEQNMYSYLTMAINNTPQNTSKYKMLVLKRMRMIYDAKSKTEVAKFIIDNLISKEDRTLIFAGSIAQAEELCKDTFHSKSNSIAYNAFLKKEINMLSSVEALNEGQNIPDLDNAIITQLNSNSLDAIQRIGRIVRYRENHLASIYIIVFKGTVDEKWLVSALLGFDKTKIEYVNYGDLKMQYT